MFTTVYSGKPPIASWALEAVLRENYVTVVTGHLPNAEVYCLPRVGVAVLETYDCEHTYSVHIIGDVCERHHIANLITKVCAP